MTTNVVVPIVLALIAAIGASGGTYLVARRAGSGKVDTSDARSVFEAQTNYMTRLADDNADLRQRIDALEQAESECMTKLREMQRQVDQLQQLIGRQ